jgi:hypothetical protein
MGYGEYGAQPDSGGERSSAGAHPIPHQKPSGSSQH